MAYNLSIETRADGTGIVLPAQTVLNGGTLTVYSIRRDSVTDVFFDNVACSWDLQSISGGVAAGDLVPAGDGKSAVFTGALDGQCQIEAYMGGEFIVDESVMGQIIDDQPLYAVTGMVYVIAKAIVSMSEVKDYLKLTTTGVTTAENGTVLDALLATWIKEISELIEEKLSQSVQPQAVTEQLDGTGMTILYMEKARIVSLQGVSDSDKLASLQIRASALASWANMFDNIGYVFLTPVHGWRIQLLDYMIFPMGFRNIQVKYWGGFSPIPSDISKMAIEMIQIMWDESSQGTHLLGRVSKAINEAGQSTNVGLKDMAARWEETFTRYRKTGVA